MANNNVQNVRFLRNGSLYATRDAALTGLNGQSLAAEQDGSIILARYGSGNAVKTLVGLVYVNGDNKSLTIFDIEGASDDVEKLRQEINAKLGNGIGSSASETVTAQLTALSGTSGDASGVTSVWGAKAYTDDKIATLDAGPFTAGDGAFIKSVSQADGKVSATMTDMPTVAVKTEDGKPIIAVSQTKGTIAASAGTIDAKFVDIDDTARIITATTVEGALAEIATEIDAMDLAVVSGDGEVITAVSEDDGKVSASKTPIKDVKLTGYAKNTSTGAISANDDIEDALSKLENKAAAITIGNTDHSINVTTSAAGTDIAVNIKSDEKVIKLGNDGIYTNLNVVKITNDLPAEIKERYELRDSSNIKIGESIDIAKDSHIVSISYDESTQKLTYTYIDVSGNTQTTDIDMSHLILETEFASGVTFSDGVAHGVVDATSENFLTVGANGFKLAGVQNAIDTAISGLDATVGSTTIATDKHVAVEVVEVDGKLTALNINENNIADADDLTQEIADREGGDTALSNRLGNNVTESNTASAQFAALSGNAQSTSADTSVEGAKRYADGKVAAVVEGLDADKSGSTTHVGVRVEEVNGVITAVTVSENDIANASDLTAEIAARKAVDGQSGQTYSANASSPYISDASNLNDADVKLAAALNTVDNAMLTRVVAGNGIDVTDKSSKSQTISAKVKNDGGIVNDENGLHLGYIDAGEYPIA